MTVDQTVNTFQQSKILVRSIVATLAIRILISTILLSGCGSSSENDGTSVRVYGYVLRINAEGELEFVYGVEVCVDGTCAFTQENGAFSLILSKESIAGGQTEFSVGGDDVNATTASAEVTPDAEEVRVTLGVQDSETVTVESVYSGPKLPDSEETVDSPSDLPAAEDTMESSPASTQ